MSESLVPKFRIGGLKLPDYPASNVRHLHKFGLPDSEFDLDVKTTLTTKATNEVKTHPVKYRFLSNTSSFDFLESGNP